MVAPVPTALSARPATTSSTSRGRPGKGEDHVAERDALSLELALEALLGDLAAGHRAEALEHPRGQGPVALGAGPAVRRGGGDRARTRAVSRPSKVGVLTGPSSGAGAGSSENMSSTTAAIVGRKAAR